MELKIVNALPAYVPDPPPLDNEDVSRYLDVELTRISESLRPLLDTFNPAIAANLISPLQPGTLSPTIAPVTTYDIAYTAYSDAYQQLEVNQLTGEISLHGDATVNILISLTANIIIDITGLAHNNDVRLFMGIGGVWEILDIEWIASAQQDFVTLNGNAMFLVPADSVLLLGLSSSGTGTIIIQSGSFNVRYVDNDEDPRL